MKLSKKKLKQKAFTLVELVIVIAIVIILSVVSVPIYRNYVDKAKLSEGYALLGTILTAQKAYYSEHGNFLRWDESNKYTCNEPILGIDARGNKYFTWFRVGINQSYNAYNSFSAFAYKPSELWNNGFSQICLNYKIDKGPSFEESNAT